MEVGSGLRGRAVTPARPCLSEGGHVADPSMAQIAHDLLSPTLEHVVSYAAAAGIGWLAKQMSRLMRELRATGSWVSLWYGHPASTQYTNALFLTPTQVCIACGVEGINQANVVIDYVS